MDSELADLAEVILAIGRELGMGMAGETTRLTPSEAYVMRFIDSHPGAAPSDVAKHTGLRRSNLSTVLRGLERSGFVERRVNPHDARGANLFSTVLAAENLAKLRRQWAGRMAIALGDDTREIATAKAVLDRAEAGLLAGRLG